MPSTYVFRNYIYFIYTSGGTSVAYAHDMSTSATISLFSLGTYNSTRSIAAVDSTHFMINYANTTSYSAVYSHTGVAASGALINSVKYQIVDSNLTNKCFSIN